MTGRAAHRPDPAAPPPRTTAAPSTPAHTFPSNTRFRVSPSGTLVGLRPAEVPVAARRVRLAISGANIPPEVAPLVAAGQACTGLLCCWVCVCTCVCACSPLSLSCACACVRVRVRVRACLSAGAAENVRCRFSLLPHPGR